MKPCPLLKEGTQHGGEKAFELLKVDVVDFHRRSSSLIQSCRPRKPREYYCKETPFREINVEPVVSPPETLGT